jgi:hypothetical protein
MRLTARQRAEFGGEKREAADSSETSEAFYRTLPDVIPTHKTINFLFFLLNRYNPEIDLK